MAIQFRCGGCGALMQVSDDAAGKKARCPKCQTVVTVPAAAPPAPEPPAPPAAAPNPKPPVEALPSAEEEEAAISETRPQRPKKKKSLASPAAKSRRYADDDDDDEDDRPRRKPVKKSSSIGPVIMLSVLGVVVLGCMGCMGFGWWSYDRAKQAQAEMDAANQAAVPPPAPDVNNQWNQPPGGPPPIAPPPPVAPPWQPPQPAPPEPPTKVALAGGKFEVEVTPPAQPADPNNAPNSPRYQFDAKADAVYRVTVGGNPQSNAHVDAPAGALPVHRDGFGNELRRDFAFQAKAGQYTVTLELPRFNNNQATKLTVRELGPDDTLPPALRLKTEVADLPTLTKTVERKAWLSAFAFSPDNKVFWMAHMDATLSYWDHPGMLRKGSYKMGDKNKPQGLTVLGVDKKGRLYGQMSANTAGVRLEGPTASDLSVWENLGPDREEVPMPPPTKTIPLRGVVKRFANAPDGRWLYFLDTVNRKVGRIDPEKAAIDKEIDNISPGTKSFCVTADGKKIYCCSDSNRVDVIDAEAFKLERSVKLDRGQPTDIAATNGGLVYLVGTKIDEGPGASGNIMVVDLTRGAADSAPVIVLNQWILYKSVRVLPDQRAVLFGGDRRIATYSIPSRPAVFSPVAKETGVGDFFTPNEIEVSPDSRTVIHDISAIFSVSR